MNSFLGYFLRDPNMFYIFMPFNKTYIVQILLKEHKAVCF